MLKTRKRWISLLVALTFLLSLLPAGAVFAGDPVTFSNAVQKGISDNDDTPLGWVKISIDDAVPKTAVFYVTLTLPDGVDYEAEPDNGGQTGIADYVEATDRNGNSVAELVYIGDPDKDELTVRVSDNDGVDYIQFKFDVDNKSYVFVESGYNQDIKVNVSVRAIESGFELWPQPYTASLTVGTLGDKEITVTAGSPKTVSAGTGKELAKITIQENLADALTTSDVVYLELTNTDYFQFTGATIKNGSYGLAATASVIPDGRIKVAITDDSDVFGDKLEITPIITVYPGASGDVDVEVTCPTNSKFKDATLTLGTLSETDVQVSTSGEPDDIYLATLAQAGTNELKTIKFQGSAKFASGDTFTLTLPKGFEWYSQPDVTGLAKLGIFNDNRSMWYKIDTLSDDEFSITGLQVNVAANAPVGDITVSVTGDLGEHSVVVGECKARATFAAEKPNVVVGLSQAAGNITITETKKDSLGNETIKLTLPTGVKFSGEPTVEVNGDELTGASDVVLGTDKDYVEINLSGMRTAKVDTIVISNIKYDLDSRVPYGDIVLKVKGAAFNDLGTTEINDTDGDDAVATVANAVVVSPTAAEAVLTIGSTTMTVNGKEVTMDVAPYLKDGRTFLPVRFAANAVGVSDANIIWDGANQRVTILKGDRIVQMTIGEKTLLLNGASIPMDVAPEVVPPGRTMLPIRFLAMALGADIAWNPDTQTVTIKVE